VSGLARFNDGCWDWLWLDIHTSRQWCFVTASNALTKVLLHLVAASSKTIVMVQEWILIFNYCSFCASSAFSLCLASCLWEKWMDPKFMKMWALAIKQQRLDEDRVRDLTTVFYNPANPEVPCASIIWISTEYRSYIYFYSSFSFQCLLLVVASISLALLTTSNYSGI